VILRWELIVVLSILVAVAVRDPWTWWAIACWFCAGMVFERFVSIARTTARAAVRLAQAEATINASREGCTCHAPGGYPHEPDCEWWERRRGPTNTP
jgi:hypothetical protein